MERLPRWLNFNITLFIIIAVFGGLYELWLVLGLLFLGHLPIQDIDDKFKGGSLFFYSISLISGVGSMLMSFTDNEQSSTERKARYERFEERERIAIKIFALLSAILVAIASALYVGEEIMMRKMKVNAWDPEYYLIAQFAIALISVILALIVTVVHEQKKEQKRLSLMEAADSNNKNKNKDPVDELLA